MRIGSLRRMEVKLTGDEQVEKARGPSPNDMYSFILQKVIDYYVPDTHILNIED